MIDCTVIVCVYNKESYIKRSIYSVMNQTLCVKKIIIVDDGSSDSSLNKIKELQVEFGDKIQIVANQKNLGLVRSRNIAYQFVDSEYVAFLDADDYWMLNKIELQYAEIQNGFDFIYNSYCWVRNDLALTNRFVLAPSLAGASITENLLEGNLISGSASAVLCTFSNICKVGYSDGNLKLIANDFGEDWDLWLRLSRVSNVSFVPDVLTYLDAGGEYSSGPVSSIEKIKRFKSHFYIRSKHVDNFLHSVVQFQADEYKTLLNYLSKDESVNLVNWMNKVSPTITYKINELLT